jgi:hypothetical protein
MIRVLPLTAEEEERQLALVLEGSSEELLVLPHELLVIA